MSPAAEVPPDVLRATVSGRTLSAIVAEGAYPLAALYGAAYVFLDRCWVLLDRPSPAEVRVSLTYKTEPPEGALDALAGELAEELVSCAWRAGVAGETRSMIEQATSRAHSGADAGPSLDDLTRYEFGDDATADPLGLAMSWEEAHATAQGAAPAPEKKEGE